MRQRSGISHKVTSDVVRRLKNIKNLWFAVHNDPDISVQDASPEFFYAVGALLEGKGLEQLELRYIDKARVLKHAKES